MLWGPRTGGRDHGRPPAEQAGADPEQDGVEQEDVRLEGAQSEVIRAI